MKKQTVITLFILLILGVILAGLIIKQKEEKKENESIDIVISKDLSKDRSKEQQESTVETSKNSNSEKSSIKNESSSKESADINVLLNDFGKKWVNYSTIFKRNQSVKEYLTDQAIKDNSIDVDPHADFEAKGKITDIYQKTDTSNQYVLLGEEESKGNRNKIVIQIDVVSEENDYKINRFTVNYMRQLY
ncbi:MAG: EF0163 family protein [Enterococcus faecalis]|nr:EF0163 family protein [Enterococcus faecalis]